YFKLRLDALQKNVINAMRRQIQHLIKLKRWSSPVYKKWAPVTISLADCLIETDEDVYIRGIDRVARQLFLSNGTSAETKNLKPEFLIEILQYLEKMEKSKAIETEIEEMQGAIYQVQAE
ncbi:MAG TPA: hypothetical protein VGQ59_03525, partial [Cyclobacteriaceae bacterium]|nr:hypothetical protein [Cyclobacteriaceae bacterium]